MQVDEQEHDSHVQRSKHSIKLLPYMGGRAAEEVIFDRITSGASNDIEQATKIARAMITRYGMQKNLI